MIKSFKHKGIERFFRMAITSGIQAKHITKLRIQLTALNAAKRPQDMSAPSWKRHQLKGKDAILVDYQDYH